MRPRHPKSPRSRGHDAMLARVRSALRKVLPRTSARAFQPAATLMGDLGIDSLKVAELSVALEGALGRPVFLGEVLADLEDPTRLTVGGLAARLARRR